MYKFPLRRNFSAEDLGLLSQMRPEEVRVFTQDLHRCETPHRKRIEYAINDVELKIVYEIIGALCGYQQRQKQVLVNYDPRDEVNELVRDMLLRLRKPLEPNEVVCSAEDCEDFHDYRRVPDVMGIISDAVILLRQKVQNDFWKKIIEVGAREKIRNLHTDEGEQRDSQMSISLANHVFQATAANLKNSARD